MVAIGQLLARYCHMLDSDTTTADEVAGLFTEDGIVEPHYAGDVRYVGRDEVCRFFHEYLGITRKNSMLRRHLISSEHIEVDGDTATAHAFLDASGIQHGADPHLGLYVGSYQDTLRRVHRRWYFSRRVIMLDWAWKADTYTICRSGTTRIHKAG